MDMYAKTQKVNARMGNARDWNTDVPNIKLSRAFVVVLILHVVAVGGILAFEMFKSEPSEAQVASSEGMAQVDPDKPAVLDGRVVRETEETGFVPASDAGDDDGYMRYMVQSGDSIRFIADTYNISRTGLLAANNINERHPLVPGRILRIPRALLSVPNDSPAGTALLDNKSIASQGNENSSGFIPLKSAGVIADVSAGSTLQSESPSPANNELTDDGFLPLLNAHEPTAPAASVSRDIKKSVRPRVLRELPVTTTVSSKRTVVTSAAQHTVVAGDTLYGISRKYGVSVNDLIDVNPGVTPRSLRIGKTLRIP